MGYALLATKRYAKALWKCSHYLHAIIGYIVFWLTVIQSVISIKKLEGIDLSPHNIIGVIVFAIVPIATFSGSATAMAGKPFIKTP
jgi:transcriptional regulator of heat shock response